MDAGVAGQATIPVTLQVTEALPTATWWFEQSGAGPGVSILDTSLGGHHGTTVGPGTAPALGASGRGRLFNGLTDSVVVNGPSALTPQRMTVRVWVKLMQLPSSFGVIVSQFGGPNSKGWYLAVKSTGEVILMGATPPPRLRGWSRPGSFSPGAGIMWRRHSIGRTGKRGSTWTGWLIERGHFPG